ncbi:hypothetical protein [Variovorax sp. UC74_104]|uniref:hypothetical protein n=1 Tax=Variovorax sp. UC74_104 TaxID=3374555 RepID=UPI003757076E
MEACSSTDAALREATCKSYPNSGGTAIYKPTGLLHDFGENNKMYFGLLSGSYQKNIAGGILRRNMSSFADEVNPQTGVFQAGVAGVVANIDRLRLIGFNGSQYNDCGWITDGPISGKTDPSICSMWGNPVGEMMFETMRYFGGATGAHSLYDYGSGAKDSSDPLNLSKPDWVSPYAAKPNGGGYQHCARPVMTVLSDINPSYDTKIPGSRYQSSVALNADALTGFNVANEVQAIGAAEGIHGKSFFIGQSNSTNANGAPSVKTVEDLSWVRGLSPQEPSKEGSYYSAGRIPLRRQQRRFRQCQGQEPVDDLLGGHRLSAAADSVSGRQWSVRDDLSLRQVRDGLQHRSHALRADRPDRGLLRGPDRQHRHGRSERQHQRWAALRGVPHQLRGRGARRRP